MQRNLAILKKQFVEIWLNRKPQKQEVFSHFGKQKKVKVVCLFVCLFSAVLCVLKTSDGGLGFVGVGFFWVFGESRRERKSSTYCSPREKKFDTLLRFSFADLQKNKVAEFGFFLGFIDPCFERARRLLEQSNRTSGGGDLGFVVFVSYFPIRQ